LSVDGRDTAFIALGEAIEGFWTMNKVLGFAAVAEALTGLALLVVPSLVAQLLLGQHPAGAAIPVARVTGIALIALGISCGPVKPLFGMFAYGLAVTLYLAYVGFAGEFVGVLLWPAVVVHAILSILLGRAWLVAEAASR
jgi:hypothetical protein